MQDAPYAYVSMLKQWSDMRGRTIVMIIVGYEWDNVETLVGYGWDKTEIEGNCPSLLNSEALIKYYNS